MPSRRRQRRARYHKRPNARILQISPMGWDERGWLNDACAYIGATRAVFRNGGNHSPLPLATVTFFAKGTQNLLHENTQLDAHTSCSRGRFAARRVVHRCTGGVEPAAADLWRSRYSLTCQRQPVNRQGAGSNPQYGRRHPRKVDLVNATFVANRGGEFFPSMKQRGGRHANRRLHSTKATKSRR